MVFTIVLPVYGHSPWLGEALESIIAQKSRDWKLLIADDGSDAITKHYLQKKLSELQDQRIEWIQRPKNLGLFKNLNQSIRYVDTDWIVLLCSDDKLHSNAITSLKQLRQGWPESGLILSTFCSINTDGSLRPPDSSFHHDQLRIDTGLVTPEQMVAGLLRLGSLNGNLTGMAFSKAHWEHTGPFREDWRHAADWEWLIRASETKSLLLNRSPIASVRTHDQQLSVRNRQSGHECQEVSAVINSLLMHPTLINETQKMKWATHVLQYQLWNSIKNGGSTEFRISINNLKAIHKAVGIRRTLVALIAWFPSRIRKKLTNKSN